ncbi:outer membrane protein assembly factor BamC [Vibrio agarivorans]|uniref:Outer membrane protein assembly factor BamC n=1 Tax=Vibrio agarivorans TaxID=153622 RepID=A0ABT7XXU5_9VIBR|nr:outer membrane protein assembly factor BamC [Vibrio agarivorans]MDN2480592.1 outer membrane protein assembly factor BamC [Vibrio agarivorans]MDN3662787.1 outer membrane protein assembly factor BamC [Vibrio agarivorans]
MKFSHQLVVGSLAVFVLSACSGSASQRRQAKDDFEYLNTPELTEWKAAEGSQVEVYPNYRIPQGEYQGEIGRSVDIRPPQQILELIPGARVERDNGEATLWLLRGEEQERVWQTMLGMLANTNTDIVNQTNDRVETGWVTWNSEDEDVELGSRYEITRFEANNRYGFKISLIDWKEAGTVKPVSATNKERYNALMTNQVTARYDQQLREEAERKAQELVKQIPITMGTDRSGLPVIIARTQYNVLWQRLPSLMPNMGFTIEERNQSQGQMKARFAAQDDEFWQEIGVKPVNLEAGVYTFLFGDLGNRTSINITDSKGKPVAEELLQDMAPVIAALVSE